MEKQKDALKGKSTTGSIACPDGITIYPFNRIYFWWFILSLAGIIGFGIRWLVLNEKDEKEEPLIKIRENRVKA